MNVLDGLRYATLMERGNPEVLRVLYPVPLPASPWGVMLPMRDTSWADQIPVVTGEALSHALHGYLRPLREMLGNPPTVRAMRVPMEDRMCWEAQAGICEMAKPECHPGSGALPECYAAPTDDRVLRALGVAVGRAWDEGRYVFVVEGPGFVVT